jgi:glycosyltransferase involved in cell wall biosynthesis
MNRMKIGFFAPDLTLTHGWGTYTVSLLRALQAQGIETMILAARNSPPVADLPALPILPTIAPNEPYSLPLMALQVPQVRQALAGCDLLHTTVERYAPLAAAVRGKRPLFITAHGSYVHLPRIRRFPVNTLYQWAFRQATLICVSHYTAQIAQRLLPQIKTIVVNNGVDGQRFAAIAAQRTPNATPLILTTGGIKQRKGTLPLVQALAQVREEIPTVRGVIVGSHYESAYTAQVQTAIQDLRLQETVILTGRISDAALLDYYRQATVFVMPALNVDWMFEGFGLVLLEASAAGLPVIGTTDNGAADAVEAGVTGLLVSQTNLAHELPAAILRIVQNPALAQQMGMAGHRKAQQQTWERVAAQMVTHYTQALAQRR